MIPSLNFNDRLTDIEKEIAQLDKRNLSVFGKVTVAKTTSILLSKIRHIPISLPPPDTNFIKKLEHILFNYVLIMLIILSSPLWYNDYIIVDGSPIFYKCMHDHGINFVSDLVDSKGKFHSYQ